MLDTSTLEVTPADLQKWRETAKLSQVALARLLNIHSLTVSKWERGERGIPPYLHVALWAIEHGYTPDQAR